jgi:NhaA family Na+:H+ antiporter
VWLTIVQSGIHGTIAGVLMAGLAPVRPVVRQGKFVELVDRKIRDFRQSLSRHEDPGTAMLESADQQSTAEEIRDAAVMVTTPIRRWERALDTPVNLLVLPVFALLNAGIAVDAGSLQLIAEHPVTLGIAAGLVVGKPVGVFLTTFLAVRLGLCDLPKGMSYSHLAGVGLLAGIGFTMSVFISGLAFADGSDELLAAKGGILLSSFIAAIAAMLWLRAFSIRQA